MGATILIVDDHARVRAHPGIAAQEPDIHVVGEAEDGADAIRLTHELRHATHVLPGRLCGMRQSKATPWIPG